MVACGHEERDCELLRGWVIVSIMSTMHLSELICGPIHERRVIVSIMSTISRQSSESAFTVPPCIRVLCVECRMRLSWQDRML